MTWARDPVTTVCISAHCCDSALDNGWMRKTTAMWVNDSNVGSLTIYMLTECKWTRCARAKTKNHAWKTKTNKSSFCNVVWSWTLSENCRLLNGKQIAEFAARALCTLWNYVHYETMYIMKLCTLWKQKLEGSKVGLACKAACCAYVGMHAVAMHTCMIERDTVPMFAASVCRWDASTSSALDVLRSSEQRAQLHHFRNHAEWKWWHGALYVTRNDILR